MNSISLEELPNVTLDKAFVEVTTDSTGKPSSINKESPKGVDNAGAGRVGEAIRPGMSGGEIDNDEAMGKTSWTLTIPVPNVHANGMEFVLGAFE